MSRTDTSATEAPKHTPGPWSLSGDGQRIIGTETPDEQPVIAEIYGAVDTDQEGYANAAFIIRAVNCHAELLENLKRIVFRIDGVDGSPSIGEMEEARAAIARAEGRAS